MGKNTVAIVLELRGHQLAAAIAALAKEGYRSFKRERLDANGRWKVENNAASVVADSLYQLTISLPHQGFPESYIAIRQAVLESIGLRK